MKLFFKKDQSKKINELSKREDKRNVNIQWNSRLFFQVGLIVSLLIVFIVVESVYFENNDFGVKFPKSDPYEEEVFVLEDYIIFDDIQKTTQKELEVEQNTIIRDIIKIVDNTFSKSMAKLDTSPKSINIEKGTTLTKANSTTKKGSPENIRLVENAPVFPGCESVLTNSEKIACLSSKINNLISKRFDREIAVYENLSGKQTIYCTFIINSNGDVVDVQTRANNEALAKEAKRVVNLIPLMKPAKQGNTNVSVTFSVPIKFIVSD